MTAVLRYTWKEMLRKRVTLMCTIMTALFWVAYWFIVRALMHDAASYTDPDTIEGMIARFSHGGIGLGFGFLFATFAVAFLAIFSAVSSISGEAESGVIQSVLARPLRRSHYYAGRWLGFVSFGVCYAMILFASILAITYAHGGIVPEPAAIARGALLFAAVVPLLVSVTMLGSCFLSPLGNGIGATLLFSIGWLGGMIERVVSTENDLMQNEALRTLQTITGIISMAMPADGLQQRMMAELFSVREIAGLVDVTESLGPFSLAKIPSNAFLGYAVVYTVALMLLGMLALRRKDF